MRPSVRATVHNRTDQASRFPRSRSKGGHPVRSNLRSGSSVRTRVLMDGRPTRSTIWGSSRSTSRTVEGVGGPPRRGRGGHASLVEGFDHPADFVEDGADLAFVDDQRGGDRDGLAGYPDHDIFVGKRFAHGLEGALTNGVGLGGKVDGGNEADR